MKHASMRKPKTNKPTKKKKLPTILGTVNAYEYIRTNPVTEAFIDHVCKKLREYSRSEDALFIECFIRNMNIPHQTFYNWIKTWPQLAEAVKEAKINIAYGRAEGSAKRRFDKGTIAQSQYRFGQEWRDDDAYQAALKAKQEDQQGNITVILPDNPKVIDRTKYIPINGKEDKDDETKK